MSKINYVIFGFLVFLIMYKVFAFLIFLVLNAKLKEGNFDTFTRVLGENYQQRLLLNGLKRYKWSYAWIIVKADFDEKGMLICSTKRAMLFPKLKSQILFTF